MSGDSIKDAIDLCRTSLGGSGICETDITAYTNAFAGCLESTLREAYNATCNAVAGEGALDQSGEVKVGALISVSICVLALVGCAMGKDKIAKCLRRAAKAAREYLSCDVADIADGALNIGAALDASGGASKDANHVEEEMNRRRGGEDEKAAAGVGGV